MDNNVEMKTSLHKINTRLDSDTVKNKFKDLNSIVSLIILSYKDDYDNPLLNEERTEKMIEIFSEINNDIEEMRKDINNLLDEQSKDDFNTQNIKLDSDFYNEVKLDSKNLSLGNLNLNSIGDKSENDQIIFNKKEIKIISDHMKKEIDLINKEIETQEKHIANVRENINKIIN